MFKLANHNTETNALALVEDLINMPIQEFPTHLIYSDGYIEYVSELHNTTPEYFTHSGWYKYIADHLDKVEFKDDCAVYQLINLKMQKNKLFVSTADLMEQNKKLTQKVAQLTYELIQTREINSFTGVLFSGVYPAWKTEAEFIKLDDYKYISLVLDRVVDTFDHNFSTSYKIGISCNSCERYPAPIRRPTCNFIIMNDLNDVKHKGFTVLPPFDSDDHLVVPSFHSDYIHNKLFDKSNNNKAYRNNISCLHSLYIIGVIAGWIHRNIKKILPYEYLIFIDCTPHGISFKLVTLKKHVVCPKRFLYDWRRFIITGMLQ